MLQDIFSYTVGGPFGETTDNGLGSGEEARGNALRRETRRRRSADPDGLQRRGGEQGVELFFGEALANAYGLG